MEIFQFHSQCIRQLNSVVFVFASEYYQTLYEKKEGISALIILQFVRKFTNSYGQTIGKEFSPQCASPTFSIHTDSMRCEKF